MGFQLSIFATKLFELFNGRTNAYAVKTVIDGKKTYAPARNIEGTDLEFTEEVCEAHLKGEISVGCYPLDNMDMVKWVALDFDGKRGNALVDACHIKRVLETELGLFTWLEKSQSGLGIHLWVFFEEKLPAKVIRTVFGSYIPEFNTPPERRTTSFDRMFPNQDSAFGSYGNLCALPLNGVNVIEGKTAFIDEHGKTLDQRAILDKVFTNRNKTATVLNKVKAMPVKAVVKQMPIFKEIPGGTKLMCPAGCAWLRKCQKNGPTLSEPEWYAALGQFARVENGDLLAHKFSQAYPGYSEKETERKLDHAREAPAMTCQTVRERFGDCGRVCDSQFNFKAPWELAKIPLNKLEGENKGKVHTAKDLALVAKQILDDTTSGKKIGFAWGYDHLDDVTELRPRNLVVVAARQGIGKTACMIDASILGAERGVPQYIFSIEMGYEELSLRYAARLTEIDHSYIATGKITPAEYMRVLKALDQLKVLPIYVDDSTRDQDRMLDNAGELIYKNGSGVIWVDYLQLVRRQTKETKKDAVDRVVDGYKQMAKILDVPVVTLAQLNRTEETTESSDDLDSWLKDSGDIEQTADVIHYLRGKRGPGTIDRRWRVHKERHRASGINLRFEFQQGIFKMISRGFWDNVNTEVTPSDTLLFLGNET